MSRTLKRVRNFCILLSVAGVIAASLVISHQKPTANAASMPAAAPMLAAQAAGAQPGITPSPGYSTVGQAVWNLTGGTIACLSSGGTATTSIPCALVWVESSGGTTGGAVYVGTSGSVVGPILAGSAAYTAIPVSNVNQLYVESATSGTTATVGVIYFNP